MRTQQSDDLHTAMHGRYYMPVTITCQSAAVAGTIEAITAGLNLLALDTCSMAMGATATARGAAQATGFGRFSSVLMQARNCPVATSITTCTMPETMQKPCMLGYLCGQGHQSDRIQPQGTCLHLPQHPAYTHGYASRYIIRRGTRTAMLLHSQPSPSCSSAPHRHRGGLCVQSTHFACHQAATSLAGCIWSPGHSLPRRGQTCCTLDWPWQRCW